MIAVEDSVLEDSETFEIAVSSSDPDVSLGSIPAAAITILDNDGNAIHTTT